MKKNIGSYNACYPMPIVVVGAMVEGKPSWFEVAWVGIGDQDEVTLCVHDHYTTQGMDVGKPVSIALVNDKILQRADYVGIVSGHKVDKSKVFECTIGELGAPIINDADVVMECEVTDIYDHNGAHLLFCHVKNTYAEESMLDEKGKVDFDKCKPILFEPRFKYYRTGEAVGPCIAPGKEYAQTLS